MARLSAPAGHGGEFLPDVRHGQRPDQGPVPFGDDVRIGAGGRHEALPFTQFEQPLFHFRALALQARIAAPVLEFLRIIVQVEQVWRQAVVAPAAVYLFRRKDLVPTPAAQALQAAIRLCARSF